MNRNPFCEASQSARGGSSPSQSHPMFDYKNQTALITGASSGIGARSSARAGGARNAPSSSSRARSTSSRPSRSDVTTTYGVHAHVVGADLSKPGAARRVLEQTNAKHPAIDVLVNNAGFGTYAGLEEISLERQHEEIMPNCAGPAETRTRSSPRWCAGAAAARSTWRRPPRSSPSCTWRSTGRPRRSSFRSRRPRGEPRPRPRPRAVPRCHRNAVLRRGGHSEASVGTAREKPWRSSSRGP